MEIPGDLNGHNGTTDLVKILSPKMSRDLQEINESMEIFKRGSKTYFNSSRFFPAEQRHDIAIFYSFVRVADNLVDSIPQDRNGFLSFVKSFRDGVLTGVSGNSVVDRFLSLMRKVGIEPDYVNSFLDAMEMDLTKTTYQDIDDLLKYMYGSAEVIGLMMSRILGISRDADEYARMLGRSMQFLNFIRDVNEDNALGRTYLPTAGTPLDGIKSLKLEDLAGKDEEFKDFMRKYIDLFFRWDHEARVGFRYIPGRFLIPISTAQNMYVWTARKIYKDPLVVFKRKVKPSKARILLELCRNWLLWKFHLL